jgi:hypothetical protein
MTKKVKAEFDRIEAEVDQLDMKEVGRQWNALYWREDKLTPFEQKRGRCLLDRILQDITPRIVAADIAAGKWDHLKNK